MEAFRAAIAQVFDAHVEASSASVSVDLMQSPVGTLLLAATDSAVCSLEFVDAASLEARLHSLRQRVAGAVVTATNRCLALVRNQLEEYFEGRRRAFDVPLSFVGTAFQQKVWTALLEIRYGETWSYLQLAEHVGDAGATRAVGMANGANPIAIVIPCHRVVNASGELGGYGGGLWRKRVLLDLEKGQAQLPF